MIGPVILRGIFFRSIAVVLAALASFMLVIGLLIAVGLDPLLQGWEQGQNQAIAEVLKTRLLEQAASGNPVPDGQTLLEALPTELEYLILLDGNSELLFSWRRENGMPGQGRNLIRRLQEEAAFHHVEYRGQLWFSFAADVPSFRANESNRILLAAAGSSVLWGSLLAAIIAVLFAILLSRPLARQARALAHDLQRIASGERAVVVSHGGIREVDDIAASTERLQQALVHEEELRRQWAADIAHDLRTPVTALKGQFEGMLDGVFVPDRARLERNFREVQRLEHMVTSFSMLTRMESPGFTLKAAALSVDDLFGQLVDRFELAACERSMGLEISGTSGVVVLGDEHLLLRALSNLVDNALRYGLGGVVQLAASIDELCTDGHFATLTVSNQGLVSPETVPHVFERLYRGDSARDHEGSGLGLAIVQAVAKAHGGSAVLELDEQSGRSVFTIRSLPCLYQGLSG